MRILQIIDHLQQGGAQRIVLSISKKLPGVKILPLRVNKKSYTGVDWGVAAESLLIPLSQNNRQHYYALLKTARLIYEEQIDIVHCHLYGSWLFGVFLYTITPPGKRPAFLFTEHSTRFIDRWFYPYLIRFLARRGYMIPESEYCLKTLLSNGSPEDRTRLVRNFIDLEMFNPGPRNTSGFLVEAPKPDTQTKIVGFAGRLVPYKRWKFFLDVAETLRDENIIFLLAGDGRDKPLVIQEITRRNLKDKVFLLGYVNSMADFYRSLDLFLNLSSRESFGLSILEAQACGTPVIAFDSPNTRELGAGKSLLTVKTLDLEELAGAIVQVLKNDDRREKLIKAGLENAKQFGINKYIKELQNVYASILERETQAP